MTFLLRGDWSFKEGLRVKFLLRGDGGFKNGIRVGFLLHGDRGYKKGLQIKHGLIQTWGKRKRDLVG